MTSRIDKIADLQFQYREVKRTLDGLKLDIDREKAKLLSHMQDGHIRSQEGAEFIALRTPRAEPSLVNEALAMAWLDSQDVTDKHRYIGLKWAEFKPLAKQALKENGEIPDGVELVHSETITIREKKNG